MTETERLAGENAALRRRLVEADRALDDAEARYHAIFDTALTFMSVCTTDGLVLDVNRAALRAIQLPIEAFVGQHLWETPWFARHPEQALKIRAVLTRQRGQYVEYASPVVSQAGERRMFRFTFRPYRSGRRGEARFLLFEVHDVTQQL